MISMCKKPKARTATERREEAFRDANEDCSFNAYAGRYAADALKKFSMNLEAVRSAMMLEEGGGDTLGTRDEVSGLRSSCCSSTVSLTHYLELLCAVCATVHRSRMLLSWGRVVTYLGAEGTALQRFSFQVRDDFILFFILSFD